ncbi:hypothetical protein CpB1094 [Chlamydia pneumoniae TW-183]|uniref:Uncharacterized protein n=1 Tax=Chlamydia pneumoniae TaxID=83558 RepID=A0ABN3YQM8_CHLPN|nr:hypothetical protein CpB1094 [Chlamydia pneumoniae TW-183]
MVRPIIKKAIPIFSNRNGFFKSKRTRTIFRMQT